MTYIYSRRRFRHRKEIPTIELNHYLALAVRRISVVLGVLVLIASFGIQAKPASAATPAFVRVVHTSPDIGTADVFLDGTKLLSNFAFGTVTGYATIPPGPHKVPVQQQLRRRSPSSLVWRTP